MTRFTIGDFSIKTLIGADREYYQFQTCTPAEYS